MSCDPSTEEHFIQAVPHLIQFQNFSLTFQTSVETLKKEMIIMTTMRKQQHKSELQFEPPETQNVKIE